jgi:hypothetical protein
MDDNTKIEVINETTIRVTRSNLEITDYNIDELKKKLIELTERNDRLNFEADMSKAQREAEIASLSSLLDNSSQLKNTTNEKIRSV